MLKVVNNRDVEVTLDGRTVDVMVDSNGSETNDPTDAIEFFMDDGDVIHVDEGSTIIMTIHT